MMSKTGYAVTLLANESQSLSGGVIPYIGWSFHM